MMLSTNSHNGPGPAITQQKRKKNKYPVVFCRPGIPQVPRAALEKEILDAMAKLSLNEGRNVSSSAAYASFEDMGLDKDILKGIHANGLERPAFVQQRAIVPCTNGKDAIIQAQSGMGKTAALVISVLQRLDKGNPHCQALILLPTRELAEQMEEVVYELSKFMKTPNGTRITTFSCIGGRPLGKCKEEVGKGKQIIIGTLGRTLHMLQEGDGDGSYLNPDSIKVLALDEADQLLGGEFGRDLTLIFKKIPVDAQAILMSATMPPHILKHAWKFTRNPLLILVKDYQLTLDGIKQYYVSLGDESDRFATLMDIFDVIITARGMIFCNSRDGVRRVMRMMRDAGKDIAHINGDMEQVERDGIMQKFRRGEQGYRVIITSDLLGRGIDIQQINLVINYEVPKLKNKEQYIHRVGRTGRYGRKGIAISFVGPNDQEDFENIKAFYQTEIKQMPMKRDLMALLEDCGN